MTFAVPQFASTAASWSGAGARRQEVVSGGRYGLVDVAAMGDRTSAAEIERWSCAQVAKWLRHNGMHHVAQTFVDQRVDGYVLLRVTDTELETVLNCRAFGDRKRILEFVQQHQPKPTWPPKKEPTRVAAPQPATPASPTAADNRRTSNATTGEGGGGGSADPGAGGGTGAGAGASPGSQSPTSNRRRSSARPRPMSPQGNVSRQPLHSPMTQGRRNTRSNKSLNQNAANNELRRRPSSSRMWRSQSATSVRRTAASPERPKFRTMSTLSKDRLGGPGPGGACSSW